MELEEEIDWSENLGLLTEEEYKKATGLKFNENKYLLFDMLRLLRKGKDIEKARLRLEELEPENCEQIGARSYLLSWIYWKHDYNLEKAVKEMETAIKACPDKEKYKKYYNTMLGEYEVKKCKDLVKKITDFSYWLAYKFKSLFEV